MNKPMANSMEALKWLYMVLAGLALEEGIRRFLLDKEGRVDLRADLSLVVFLILVSFVTRFAHGAIRHFNRTYMESDEPQWYPCQPLVDFVGLFAEAFAFFLMAFSQAERSEFFVYLLILLAIDSLWIFLIALPRSLKPFETPPLGNWLRANALFLPTILVLVFLGDCDKWTVWIFASGMVLHTFHDYFAPGNWDAYFPGSLVPRLVQSVGARWQEAPVLQWLVVPRSIPQVADQEQGAKSPC